MSDPLPIPLPCPFLSPHRSRARGRGFALSLCERTCFPALSHVCIFSFDFFRFVLSDSSCRIANGMSSGLLQWFALRPGLGCFESFNGVPSGQWYALRLGFGYLLISMVCPQADVSPSGLGSGVCSSFNGVPSGQWFVLGLLWVWVSTCHQ